MSDDLEIDHYLSKLRKGRRCPRCGHHRLVLWGGKAPGNMGKKSVYICASCFARIPKAELMPATKLVREAAEVVDIMLEIN